MEQSYAGALICLAAAMAKACAGKKIKNDDRPACVNSKGTGSKKLFVPDGRVPPLVGIKFDNQSAGNYFTLIGSARLTSDKNKNLL